MAESAPAAASAPARQHAISARAYGKVVLHAVKWLQHAVHGVLIGHVGEGNALVAVDAVPVCHGNVYAPILELALTQIEAYARTMGVQVVGTYHANDNVRDNTLTPASRVLCDRVQSICSKALALQVDNANVGSASCCVSAYHCVGSAPDWQLLAPNMLCVEGSKATFKRLQRNIKSGLADRLWDFDDHLENVERDWRNVHLHAKKRAPNADPGSGGNDAMGATDAE